MIEELRQKIDQINITSNEENVWEIYELCKGMVRNYEREFGGFTPQEYDEYIIYIANKLGT